MENRCFNCKYYEGCNYFSGVILCKLNGRVSFSIGDSYPKFVCDNYEKNSE